MVFPGSGSVRAKVYTMVMYRSLQESIPSYKGSEG